MISNPLAQCCNHRRISTYYSYFANLHASPEVPWYIPYVHSAARQHALAQLRCGCSHVIPADCMRIAVPQFVDRTCPYCGTDAIGHVAHVCLHCPAPPLVHARHIHGWPSAIQDMRQRMHCADDKEVYAFLTHMHAAALSIGPCSA